MGKRTTGLPRYVRRHRDGFRAVLRVAGATLRSPTYATAHEASVWAERARAGRAPDRPWTLRDGFDALLLELRQTARAATIEFYECYWRMLQRDWDPDVPVHRITPAAIRAFVDRRKKDGVSDSTIFTKDLGVLGRILRLAEREGHLPDNPMRQVRSPKIRRQRFKPLATERVDALLASMRDRFPTCRQAEHQADVLDLIFTTGIRLSEAARLRREDIDMGTQQMRVDGKTGIRHLPIGKHADAVLRRLLLRCKGDGPLCGTVRGIESFVAKWQRRLQEPGFHCHALRHSFATAMARRQVDPWVLKDWLGHGSLDETLVYYHTQSDRQRAAADAVQRSQTSSASRDAAPSSDRPVSEPAATPPSRPDGTLAGG